MRILQVATALSTGGVQNVIAALSRGLAERGHEVRVLGLYGDDRLPGLDGVTQSALGLPAGRQSSLVRGVPAVRRAAAGADVVHSHAFHATFAARLAHVGASWPLVSTIHSAQEGAGLHRRLARATYGLSDAVTVVGQAAREANEASGAAPTGSLRVVHNGFDVAAAAPSRDRDAVRAELGVREGVPLVVAVGRLTAAKDYPTLLRAVARLRETRPDVRVVVAGEGEQRAALEALVEELDLRDTVTLLGNRRDVPDLLAAADVFASSSAWEGLPLVVGEAMAAGARVVATDVPGILEVAGDHALVAPRGDGDALGDRLAEALGEDPVTRLRETTAAAQRVRAEFDLDTMVDRYEELYREVVRGRGR